MIHAPMKPTTDRPLVTFALFSYNQEQFIEEAVAGALSQTYEPLEIIISDDCSQDGTFEVIQRMVRSYAGPHRVRLNRNPVNMGISRHVRHVHEIAAGEFIIHAGGDDVSYPERTSTIMRAVQEEPRAPSLVMSNAHVIDEQGNILGLFSTPETRIRNVGGDLTDFSSVGGAATYAIDRRLVAMFSRPAEEIYGEDRVLLIRAKLANGTLYIPDVLVQYRVSQYGVWSSGFIGSLPTAELLRRQLHRATDYLHILRQAVADLHEVGHSTATFQLAQIEDAARVRRNWVEVLSGSLGSSTRALATELVHGRMSAELMKLYTMRWLPFLRTVKLRLRRAAPAMGAPATHPAVQVPHRK